MVPLAGVDAGQGVLVDEQGLAGELAGEVGQATLQFGDDVRGETVGRRRRVGGAPQEVEHPPLRRVQRRRHGPDPTKGVSRGSGDGGRQLCGTPSP